MALHVLHVSVECAPFAKVGGLADVVGALPRWLRRIPGFEASVLIPYHAHLGAAGRELVLRGSVRGLEWSLWRAAEGFADFPLFLVEHEVFRDGGIYGGHPLERQVILGAAARDLALASRSGDVPVPRVDLVHAHDHHAAFAALWLRGSGMPRVVATVHNARYHGDHAWEAVADLVPADVSRGDCDHDARFNSLKAMVLAASAVTTVSPTHATELATLPRSSAGLDYAFRLIGPRLSGILNGIDTDAWDPATDPALPAPFSAGHLAGRARAKEELCRAHGLDPGRPLLAFVGRLVPEKGIDALLDAVALLAQSWPRAQWLVLGTGEARYEERLHVVAEENPGRVGAAVRHDEAFAHVVYGGADALMMPSWHEPCGLSQMYAMRYGAVPIVNPTGGLRDSVVPFDASTGLGTGAWMTASEPGPLAAAALRVAGWMREPEAWARVQGNGMRADLSWETSCARYAALYRAVAAEEAG